MVIYEEEEFVEEPFIVPDFTGCLKSWVLEGENGFRAQRKSENMSEWYF